MEKMSTYYAVDNRQVPYQDFHTDSSFASYNRNAANMIGKFSMLSSMYQWLPYPEAIAFARSPEKVTLLPKGQFDLTQVATLLESRHSSLGGSMSQNITWGSYFCDAVQKCGNAIGGKCRTAAPSGFSAKSKSGNNLIVLLSTDLCLLGNQQSRALDNGLEIFCDACIAAHEKYPGLRIRILCVIVSQVNSSDHHMNANLVNVLVRLKELKSFVSFQSLVNSTMHFSDELRCIVSQCVGSLLSCIEFPAQFGANCSLVLNLQPCTGTAANSLHGGLENPEIFSLVPRKEIDPFLIEGKGVKVTSPSQEAAQELLPTKGR
jgi:hypothetical protein